MLAVHELLQNALLNNCSLNWYIAPFRNQAKMIAWRMLKNMIDNRLIKKTNESELSVELKNGSVIELKGADHEDSLRGVGVSFLVVDEIAVIPNAKIIWGEVLRPMLTDTKGRALFIGTPKGQNFFYEIYKEGLNGHPEWKSWKFNSIDNPYIDPEEIKKARNDLPKTIYDQEYECSFITDEEKTLITSKMLDELKDVNKIWKQIKQIVSVDPSMGGDECVIYMLENYAIKDRKTLNERDTMKIAGEIAVFAKKYDINDIAIDCIGIGQGIADRLSEMKFNVMYINSAAKANESELFYNVRAEIWYYVMKLVLNKEMEAIEDGELCRQLAAVRYDIVDSNGKIKLHPKDRTKELLGRSPDNADAYVYGCWGLQDVEPKTVLDRWNRPQPQDDFNLMG